MHRIAHRIAATIRAPAATHAGQLELSGPFIAAIRHSATSSNASEAEDSGVYNAATPHALPDAHFTPTVVQSAAITRDRFLSKYESASDLVMVTGTVESAVKGSRSGTILLALVGLATVSATVKVTTQEEDLKGSEARGLALRFSPKPPTLESDTRRGGSEVGADASTKSSERDVLGQSDSQSSGSDKSLEPHLSPTKPRYRNDDKRVQLTALSELTYFALACWGFAAGSKAAGWAGRNRVVELLIGSTAAPLLIVGAVTVSAEYLRLRDGGKLDDSRLSTSTGAPSRPNSDRVRKAGIRDEGAVRKDPEEADDRPTGPVSFGYMFTPALAMATLGACIFPKDTIRPLPFLPRIPLARFPLLLLAPDLLRPFLPSYNGVEKPYQFVGDFAILVCDVFVVLYTLRKANTWWRTPFLAPNGNP